MGTKASGGLEELTRGRALRSYSQNTQKWPTNDTSGMWGIRSPTTRMIKSEAAGQQKASLHANSLTRGWPAQVEAGVSHNRMAWVGDSEDPQNCV